MCAIGFAETAATAFEAGPPNALGIAALGAAVDLLIELDPEKIGARLHGLADDLASALL